MSKKCPYCDEMIADTAVKCRFCGEWIEQPVNEPVLAQQLNMMEQPAYAPIQPSAPQQPVVPQQQYAYQQQYPQQQPYAQQPQYAQQQPYAQQQVMPQIIINNEQTQSTEVNVEQTVINSSGGISSGWLITELLAVAGAIWWATGTWWIGLLTFFGLLIAIFVPVLGQIICIVLGAGVGLVAGILSAAFDAPTWAAWVIGIIVGIGVCIINLIDREADD